ncbi:MAG: hypothetical protein ACI9HK_006085, partial [Pirellulaceae bacterium]
RGEWRNCTAVLSSRLGRCRQRNRIWLRTLAGLVATETKPSGIVILAEGMTCHPYLPQIARRQGRRFVSVWLPKSRPQQWKRWLENVLSNSPGAEIAVSPFVDESGSPMLRDSIISQLATKLLVLNVKEGGNTQRTLEAVGRDKEVVFIQSEGLFQQGKFGEQDNDSRRRRWYSIELPSHERTNRNSPRSGGELLFLEDLDDLQPLLSHWTRGSVGPWPDQTEEEFINELLSRDCPDEPPFPPPIVTLRRIVKQRRIVASGKTIRGGERVVCLTSTLLSEFRDRRVYRRHLGRWDYEPCGIAFPAAILNSQARRVVYGDDGTWDILAAMQRWRFQASETSKGVNWELEREWRVKGDLDFSNLEQISYPFVPDLNAAISLRDIWSGPIIVLKSRAAPGL